MVAKQDAETDAAIVQHKNVYEALHAAQAECGLIGKSGKNTYDKYSYANLEDYISGVHGPLAKHGLSVTTSVEAVRDLEKRTTQKGGTEHAVEVIVLMVIYHTSGTFVSLKSAGQGQDRADKSIYKAITGARKYILAQALNLATSDDPEADEGVGRDTDGNGGNGNHSGDNGKGAGKSKQPETDGVFEGLKGSLLGAQCQEDLDAWKKENGQTLLKLRKTQYDELVKIGQEKAASFAA